MAATIQAAASSSISVWFRNKGRPVGSVQHFYGEVAELEELRAEIRALKTLREQLNDRKEHTEECIWWLSPGFPEAARDHLEDLDEINGELDEISDRLGHAENDLWELEGRLGRAEFVADVAYGRNL